MTFFIAYIPLSAYIPALFVGLLLIAAVIKFSKKELFRTHAMNERIKAQLELSEFEKERRAFLENVKPHLQAVANRGHLAWHNGIKVLLNEWHMHSSKFLIDEIRQLQDNMSHNPAQALKFMGDEEYDYFLLLDVPPKVELPVDDMHDKMYLTKNSF